MSLATLIAAQRAEHGIPHAVSCRALGVSQAWFYKWRNGDASLRRKRRAALAAVVCYLFSKHHGSYGSPRITADLRDLGWRVSENTVATLLAEQGLVARRKRRRRSTTKPDRLARKAPDALGRDFTPPQRPKVRWCGDLTEIPTDEGRFYLAAILDLHSRRCVGFALGAHHDAALARAAFCVAIAVRGGSVAGLVFHTDQGGEFGKLRPDERRSRLRDFTAGDLDVLCAPKVLDEGVDIPRADLAVVIAGSTSRRQMTQRMGRILRPKPDGRRAKEMVILYAEGTAEDPSTDGRGHEMFLAIATRAADAWSQFDAETAGQAICAFLSGDVVGQQPTEIPGREEDKVDTPSRPLHRAREEHDLLRELLERSIDAWSARADGVVIRVGGRPDVIERLASLLYRAHIEQADDDPALHYLETLLVDSPGDPLVVTGWRIDREARRAIAIAIAQLSIPQDFIEPLLRIDPAQVRTWSAELRRAEDLHDEVRRLLEAADVDSYRLLCEVDPPSGLLRELLPSHLSRRLSTRQGLTQLADLVTVGIELMLHDAGALLSATELAQRTANWCVAIVEAADTADILPTHPVDDTPLRLGSLRRLLSRVGDDLDDAPVDTGLLWSDVALLYQRTHNTSHLSDTAKGAG